MRRREFIGLWGGTAMWPLAAHAQQITLPVVAFLNGSGPEASAGNAAAFREGLKQAGLVDGRDVTVEYHWMHGQYERVPVLVADLVRRRVTAIVSPGFPTGALAAKNATTTVPIVFGVGDDPVKLGLVASLARPGGNVTGINFFVHEIVSKRLGLLRELLPQAVRVAVLVNPNNAEAAEATIKEAREVGSTLGMQVVSFKASTIDQIDAAFVAMLRERADAMLLGGDGFFFGRRGQLATLAARDRLPMMSPSGEAARAGALIAYGASVPDMFRQVGIYAAAVVKGTKPADLPVLQSTKFELVINLGTARALGLDVPPTLLARADEVIE